MKSKSYGYFDDWRRQPAECPECDWHGELDQTGTRAGDGWRVCPECDTALAVVYEPSVDKARDNWDRLSEAQRAEIERIEQRLATREEHMLQFEAHMLQAPDQLPDIADDSFALLWDVANPVVGVLRTVILHGERVIWAETAHWTDHERFGQVAAILQDKYGARLEDLIPTRQAELFLYGDSLGAVHYVDAVRREMRAARRLDRPGRATG
jgi:hypothetical protein